MRVMLVGAPYNATDGFIWEGCQNLIRETLPGVEIIRAELPNNQHPGEYAVDIKRQMRGCEAVYIVGSPWFWDQDTKSQKHCNLQQLLDAAEAKQLPTLLMGGGACFPLGFNVDTYHRPYTFSRIKTIIVRDHIAADFCSSYIKLPCPAYYSNLVKPQKPSYNLLVWADPANTIAGEWWKDKRRKNLLEAEYERATQYVRDRNAEVVVTVKSAEEDLESWHRLTGSTENVRIAQDPQDSAEWYSGARHILSYRVHAAIPAFAGGIPVDLVALDTRAQTFQTYTREQLKKDKEKYRELIRKTVVPQG